MTATRVCRTCGAEKPLTLDYWPLCGNRGQTYLRWECKPCHRDHYRDAEYLSYKQRRARARAERDRYAAAAPAYISTIPDSDPWLDLQVIDCCWSDCIEAGPDAARRMVKKIVTVCQRIPNAQDLYVAAFSCLDNETTLALVRSLLDECIGLERAS